MFVPVSLGKDAISPIKLTKAEVKAVIPNADTFPIAIVDLLVGVTRRVAIVPLSFSPAIDSEQMYQMLKCTIIVLQMLLCKLTLYIVKY